MTLRPDTRLGPYEILAPLGVGGMGEVYRARDPRLDREVAVKVLSASLAMDPDALARFEREAMSVAKLSHPNILAIHEFGRATDTVFVVTELVDGETLRARLDGGALPARRAVAYALQMARGIAAAHARGIVHRDLKPENVMITRDDQVKILDFGLAKPVDRSETDMTRAPGVATSAGTVLGTFGYMAPEQVRGLAVDHRADIFAFGAVLYEMLSGERAFRGETAADTMTAILTKDPQDLDTARLAISPALDRIVRRCLEKSPDLRFQSANDLAFALDTLSTVSTSSSAAVDVTAPARHARAAWLPWAVAALALFVAASLALWVWRSDARGQASAALFLAVGPPHGRFADHPSPVISADGRRIAYWAPDTDQVVRLFVRDLDKPAARALPGTEVRGQLSLIYQPVFSPDGRNLLVFLDGKLKRVATDGGSPQTLADAPQPRGASWGVDEQVLYVPAIGGPLHLITARGGTPRALTDANTVDDRRGGPRHPYFLPDGKHFLFNDLSRIYVASIDGSQARALLEVSSRAEYAHGHLLYVKDGDLMAQPFDLPELKLTGEPTRVAERVGSSQTSVVDSTFSTSAAGTLVCWEGRMIPMAELVWFDHTGRRLGTLEERGYYNGISVSPGMTHVAVEHINAANQMATKVVELARGVATRVSLEGVDRVAAITPTYSRDGRHLWLAGVPGILRAGPQGQSPEVIKAGGMAWVTDTSPDGRWLLYESVASGSASDIWTLPLASGGVAAPYLQTRAAEHFARFSPDGGWVAYVQDETGQPEVYVDSFPVKRSSQRVSITGGLWPMWSDDGRRLYFLTPDSRLLEVRVSRSADALQVSSPIELFRAPLTNGTAERPQYWPAPDGQRFLFNVRLDTRPNTISVILDWPALVKK